MLLRRSYGLMDRHKYSFNKWSFCSVKISFSILSEIQNSWWSWTIYIYYNLVLLKTNVEVIILQHFHIFHSETSHSSLVSLSSLCEHTFSSVLSSAITFLHIFTLAYNRIKWIYFEFYSHLCNLKKIWDFTISCISIALPGSNWILDDLQQVCVANTSFL